MDQDSLQALARSTRRAPLWSGTCAAPLAIGREAIERLIPHRRPFLLLDEITGVDLPARAARGRRSLDPGDPVFAGHFPGRPIYPGVLQIEMIGQLGLCLLQFLAAGSTAVTAGPCRATRASSASRRAVSEPVWPGDDLTLNCRVVEQDDYLATCAGQIWRGDTLCALLMEVYFVDG